MNIKDAIDLVAPFCDTDPAREYLYQPYGAEGYIIGSDGHTLAAVAHDDWQTVQRENSPGFTNVKKALKDLESVGEAHFESVRNVCRLVAKSAEIHLTIGAGDYRTLVSIFRPAAERNGKIVRDKVTLVTDAYADWAGGFKAPVKCIGINARYLLRALDFCGTARSNVWMHRDPLSPIVFTPTGVTLDAPRRFAIVMPMRV